ncbi:MAG: hypothetical protein ACT4P1_00935 [Sporichthyaceae bacterium]
MTLLRISILRPAVALSTLALVVATAPGALASPGVTADSRFTNICEKQVAGRILNVKVVSLFTAEASNDLRRVKVRATDADEKGDFRNADVEIKNLKIVVMPAKGKPYLTRSGTSSPSSIKLDPTSRSSGEEARASEARVTFLVNGKKSVRVVCADIDA